MNIFDQLPDISLLFNLFRYAAGLLILWLCTSVLSGCGIKAGNSFVIGTTGFLDTAQQAQPEHTEGEKRALARVVMGGR